MKQSLLTLWLTSLLMLLCQSVSAYNFASDGLYYNITSITDLTVEVTCKSYSDGNYFNDVSGDVIIPSSVTYAGKNYSVTSIGNGAFCLCSSVTSVSIPNSVTSIGRDAFACCTGLMSIVIPNSVTSIGYTAFQSCSSLTSLFIPKSVTSIMNGIFAGCSGLTSITVASDNSNYDSRNNCNAIINTKTNELIAGCQNTIIPNDVTSIGRLAFYGCTGLISIFIPNSITSIGYEAFRNCTNLRKVYNNSSLPIATLSSDYGYIGYYAIAVYNNYTIEGEYIIQIQNDKRYVCGYLGTEASITVPANVNGIADGAFYNRNEIKNITIGESVTSIGICSLYGCTGLTSITIPNGVTSIGREAFCGCSGLASITIPNSVTSIGNYAFSGCKFRDIQVLAENPAEIGNETFSGQSRYHTTLYVPYGCYDNYAYDDTYWYMFIHIKESAAATQNLSPKQAYELKNAVTRSFIVYDAVNDAVAEISMDANIDENNANHNWQVIAQDDKTYIYNIGAKKYLYANSIAEVAPRRTATTTQWKLSATPVAMSLSTGELGINIGNGGEWLFVLNPTLSVDENVSGIEQLDTIGDTNKAYSIDGTQLRTSPCKGLYVRGNQRVLVK